VNVWFDQRDRSLFSSLLICIFITTFCGIFFFSVYDIAMVLREMGIF
jgi:hypothetical protein